MAIKRQRLARLISAALKKRFCGVGGFFLRPGAVERAARALIEGREACNGGLYVHLLTKIKKKRKLIVIAADIVIMLAVSVLFYGVMPAGLRSGPGFFWANISSLIAAIFICQLILRTYESLWRYAEAREYILLSVGSLCGYMAYIFLNILFFRQRNLLLVTMAVCASSLVLSLVMRFSYRILRQHLRTRGAGGCGERLTPRRYVAIIGAGSAGVALYEEMRRNPLNPYELWCFIDDDREKIGRKIHDVEIKGPISEIVEILKNSPVDEVILAIPSLALKRRQEILELCSHLSCKTKILPDMIMSIRDENTSLSEAVRSIKPEDLLGRSCVDLKNKELRRFIKDKVILVTGGGGSIGSELCRQIAAYRPEKLVIFDIFENNAYLFLKELQHTYKNALDVRLEIGSIRDGQRLRELFGTYRPDIVFHAAAHKHVPLMEQNPGEAVKNNIFGTHELLKAAAEFKCRKFVMISSDKAVNPTNVMGATKRYCELMVQAMADYPGCTTEFVAVRFGNVLGSNGSVVPLFMKQIERGGPVTVTDRRIIRYFMTISEAASLVLEAGSMARKSEIYVLDMGEPVRIVEFAEKLIRLSGLTPYKDIQILETGLRPGEKLYEELLINDGQNTATASRKIFIEKRNGTLPYSEIEAGIRKLEAALSEGREAIIRTLKELVPTFRTPEEVNGAVEPANQEIYVALPELERSQRLREHWTQERRGAVHT
mgnify:FL=1